MNILKKLNQSRLDALMKSNDVPSDQEASALHHQIAEKQMGIEVLGEEIEKTKALLDELIKRREREQNDLIAFKHVVSVIRRLPFEILGRIFVLSHMQKDNFSAYWYRGKISPPLVFGHVCSRWRVISHSTPRLWCSLNQDRMTQKMTASEGTHKMTKEWLSRAHPLPLDISIFNDKENDFGHMMIEDIIPLYADHIQKLDLDIKSHHLTKLLRATPLLETLTLRGNNMDHNNWNGPAISFENSPKLCSITLYSSSYLQSRILSLPWLQLTELNLKYKHPVDDLLIILSSAVNLQKCSLQGWGTIQLDSTLNSIPIVHRNLCDLTVTSIPLGNIMSPPFTSFLFRHLTLPALRHASINNCGPGELASLAEFQTRSRFLLESLDVMTSFWLHKESESIFNGLPRVLEGGTSLVKLCLTIYINNDACHWLEMLHYMPANPSRQLLPAIKTMHLVFITDRIKSQYIIDLIKTRWWPGYDTTRSGVRRLEHFTFDNRHVAFTPADTEQLREFVCEGLDLHVTGFELDSNHE